MTDPILLERPRPEIAFLRLNRPDKLNALNLQSLSLLLDALDQVDEDDACRVLIITGQGRGFCSGLDLDPSTAGPSPPLGGPQRLLKSMRSTWTRLLPRLRTLRPAVIAAVNGPAVGGGFVLALGADIRIASSEATFHDGFARMGVSGCELGLGWLLPRMIGVSRTLELALTGRRMSADDARELGLAHEVCGADELEARALAKAEEIIANPPFSVWMTRNTLWSALEVGSLQAAIELENRTQALCLLTQDCAEQQTSRREKRSPRYTNH